MSQGDPSRRCKSGHLFTSWSDLVAADDSLVGIETRDMHLLASGLEIRPLFYTQPRCKPAEDQPRLIQGIRRGDGVGDYLYAN